MYLNTHLIPRNIYIPNLSSSNNPTNKSQRRRNYSTPLLQDWLGDDAAKRHRREVHFPTGRFGEAIEQAQAVLFLASDESSFVNGTDFVVDGGMSKVRFSAIQFLFIHHSPPPPQISSPLNFTIDTAAIPSANGAQKKRPMSQPKDQQQKRRRIFPDENSTLNG